MVTLEQFRLFVRVAARRSVSRAARDLSLPQATASRWLAQLEQQYGHPLLLRSTRAVTLTHAGELCLAYAQDLIDRDQALRAALSGSRHGLAGKLKISAPSAFGTYAVLPAVAAFARENTAISIDLRLSDHYVDITAEGVDVALRIGRLDDSRLVASRVTSLREVIVCHPKLVSSRDVNSVDDVKSLPWIRFSKLKDGDAIKLRNEHETIALPVRPAFWIDNITALREAMLLGLGASLIHHYAVADDLAQGRLVALLGDWQLPKWPVSIVTPAGRRNPLAKAFSQHIRRSLVQALDGHN